MIIPWEGREWPNGRAVISWFDSHGRHSQRRSHHRAQRFEALQVDKERSEAAKCQDSALGRST